MNEILGEGRNELCHPLAYYHLLSCSDGSAVTGLSHRSGLTVHLKIFESQWGCMKEKPVYCLFTSVWKRVLPVILMIGTFMRLYKMHTVHRLPHRSRQTSYLILIKQRLYQWVAESYSVLSGKCITSGWIKGVTIKRVNKGGQYKEIWAKNEGKEAVHEFKCPCGGNSVPVADTIMYLEEILTRLACVASEDIYVFMPVGGTYLVFAEDCYGCTRHVTSTIESTHVYSNVIPLDRVHASMRTCNEESSRWRLLDGIRRRYVIC